MFGVLVLEKHPNRSKTVLFYWHLYCILTMLLPSPWFLFKLLSSHPKKLMFRGGRVSSLVWVLGSGSFKSNSFGFGTSFSGEETDSHPERCSFVLFLGGSVVQTPHCVHKQFQMFQKFCFLHVLSTLFLLFLFSDDWWESFFCNMQN